MNTMNQNVITVAISEVVDMISTFATIRVPMIIWGEPGVGKSAIVKQYAESIGAVFVDIRLSQYDAVDIRGLPDVRDGKTRWLMASTMPFVGNDLFPTDRPIVLFLDEIMHANASVQGPCFQLLHPDDRGFGEHKLLPNVIVVAAANREGDRAGTNRLLAPLANRVAHINVEVDAEAFHQYALSAGFSPAITNFLRFRPGHLSQFAEAVKTGIKAFPTPRAWETVNKVLSTAEQPRLRSMAIAAVIGTGVEAEFSAFLKVQDEVPRFSTILRDPHNAEIPGYDRRDILWSVVGMLFARAKVDNIDALMPYIKRLPIEYQVVLAADIAKNRTDLMIASNELTQLVSELSK